MKSHLTAGAALAAVIGASGALGAGTALAEGHTQDVVASPSTDDGAAPDKAWTGYAKLGYHLDPHWRLELQGGYHDETAVTEKTVDPVGGAGALGRALGQVGQCDNLWAAPACGQPDGSGQIYSYSGKLIFDFAPDNRWFDPFVGIGARLAPNNNPQLQILGFSPGDTPFAYQAMAGIAFRPIGPVHIDLTYRWTAGGLSMRATPLPGPAGRYQDQTLAIGVRYLFAAPPSPPSPLP